MRWIKVDKFLNISKAPITISQIGINFWKGQFFKLIVPITTIITGNAIKTAIIIVNDNEHAKQVAKRFNTTIPFLLASFITSMLL